MDNELYQAVLLQHSKKPRNFGPLENPTHAADGHNALCGDEISVAVRIEDDTIADAKFTGTACAICTASASIMTGEVKGLTCDAVRALAGNFRLLAKDGTGPDVPAKLQVLGGVHQFPQRVKCAVLPWETLVSALHSPVEGGSR
ncbi:MAG: SUF system NifU family Fe-S cluster assembly protein [Terrimicrobiaceae bacterium]|nr:SUF system NifU family Fe-S cluster assembly protein [Terrimicrobiaceae bacterium]